MFPRRYFTARAFPPRYFPPATPALPIGRAPRIISATSRGAVVVQAR